MIDISGPFENRQIALRVAKATKMEKYRALVERMRARGGYRTEVRLGGIFVGSLGSWDRRNDAVLSRLGIHRGRIGALRRMMVSTAIRWSQ